MNSRTGCRPIFKNSLTRMTWVRQSPIIKISLNYHAFKILELSLTNIRP